MERDLVGAVLRAGLYTRIVGRRIVHFTELSSTMGEARIRALAGEDEGLTVVADRQTSGRGRMSHAWVSPLGNIYCSILLRPPATALPHLTTMTTMAMVEAVERATALKPTVKWPNDVRIKGRKLGGVLVESSVNEKGAGFAIVGIGLNVNFDPSVHPEIAEIATSISRELGHPVEYASVLRHLLERMDALYLETREGRPPTAAWRASLETLGKRVKVRWGDEVYEGVARDVDDLGNLTLVRADGTTVALPAGEVTSQA